MGQQLFRFFILIWAFITVPTVFLILVTIPTLLVIPFPVRWRLRIVGPFWRLFAFYTLKFGCWATLHREDYRQPRFKGSMTGLYIANHQSFLDIPAALTQFQIAPIMKKEVLYIPILGLMGWAAGALVVSRGKRNSRMKVFVQAKKRLVNDNFAVQYYPEGTRSKTGHPKPYENIKATLLHLAWTEKVPVLPVSIYGTHGLLKDGWIQTGRKLGIICHAALMPEDYPDAVTFARACWDQVLKGHSQLQNSLEN